MFDRDAERDRANASRIDDALSQLLDDEIDARFVPGVERRELFEDVSASRPSQLLEARHRVVGDAVVLERHEELTIERVPEPKLLGDAPTEVGEQRLAIGALGRRRQAEERLGLEEPQDPLVGVRRRAVALVDDDEPEVVRREAPFEDACRALDRREDVLPLLGTLPSM